MRKQHRRYSVDVPHTSHVVIIFALVGTRYLVAADTAPSRMVRGIGAEVAYPENALLRNDDVYIPLRHQFLRSFRVCVVENLAGMIVHRGARR